GLTFQEHVAVVAPFDSTHPEMADRERGRAPAPARENQRRVLVAGADAGVLGVGGLESGAGDKAEAGGIPGQRRRVLADRNEGSAQRERPAAGAGGER